MAERKRCIVYRCENHTDEGTFVGDLCAPCHAFVTGVKVPGTGGYSQAYRNAIALGVEVLFADDPTGAVRKAL